MLGIRIAKAKVNHKGEPIIQTEFIWDSSHLVQEVQHLPNSQSIQNSKNRQIFSYIYTHPNSYEPLAQCVENKDENGNKLNATINYFHCDQIGIVREMTNEKGRIIWRGTYDAWGGLVYNRHQEQKNKAHQPFRLQNQYFDRETGLHYNFFRYYEPVTGRFITQDPIGLQGGENLYRFADNVQSIIDSLGLEPIDVSKTINYPSLPPHSYIL